MARLLLTILSIFPVPAFAYVAHIGATSGHGHWVIVATVAVALGAAVGAIATSLRETCNKDKLELQE